MYQVNPQEANTQLFGINKGTAQVFDNSAMNDAIKQVHAEQFARRQARQKHDDAIQAGIDDEVAKLGDEVFSRDRDMFLKGAQAISQYAKDNARAIIDGDAGKYREFQDMVNKWHQDAAISNQTGKEWYAMKRSVDEGEKTGKSYRPESLTALNEFADPKNAGNYDVSKIQPKTNFNYSDYVQTKLIPTAHKIADSRSNRGYKTFTLDEAKDLLKTDLTDANNYEQVAYDFQNDPEKFGAKNPIEYAQNKFAHYLTVDEKPQLSEWEVYGHDGTKTPTVNGRLVSGNGGNKRFQFEYANTTETPTLTVQDPRNPTQAINVKPVAVNYQMDEKNPRNSKASMQVTIKRTPEEIANGQTEEVIDLPFQQTQDIMKNKYGIPNVFDVTYGRTPKHVNMTYDNAQSTKPSAQDFNAKWATLKKGQSLVGPDGKTYTKK